MTVPTNPEFSVILPVFNEAGHLQQELDRIADGMDRSGRQGEIVVIDDGSTDGSGAIAREHPAVRLISLKRNQGYGTALRVGMSAARGDVVVWTDADMTYPNGDIAALVDALDGWDQVVGHRQGDHGRFMFLRRPTKNAIRGLASYLVEQPIPDLNSGFRAMRREVVDQFLHQLPKGFSCSTTTTMLFLANGYSIGYEPIEYAERAGKSKFHWRRDTSRFFLTVIRLILSYNPLRFFLPLAMLLFAVAGVKLGFDWARRDFTLATNTLLLFFAAFQVLLIGLLADLVVRVTRPAGLVGPAGITDG